MSLGMLKYDGILHPWIHFKRQELPIVLGSHKFANDTGNDFLLSGFDSRFLNETWHGWSWPIVLLL